MAQTKETKSVAIATDPPFIQRLFSTGEFAWLWLIARIWLGYQWFVAGEHKITDPGWMVTGTSLKGFWTNATAIPATGKPPIVFDWYRDFLKFLLDSGSYVWFAKLIAVGEVLIGVALVVGAFVGIAAFMGSFLNWNFMMAGSASTNPLLFAVATFLVLAWKAAGHWGADRWLLPALGTPWGPGKVFGNGKQKAPIRPQEQGSS